ncbi:hypothetical protein ACFOG5_12165 [Pedobacter fastidiosus]|uniref:hypothetical protein n=1 Tax=Pedobacter fastidiosus TaxID=2765361 RepID=UPI00361F0E59
MDCAFFSSSSFIKFVLFETNYLKLKEKLYICGVPESFHFSGILEPFSNEGLFLCPNHSLKH